MLFKGQLYDTQSTLLAKDESHRLPYPEAFTVYRDKYMVNIQVTVTAVAGRSVGRQTQKWEGCPLEVGFLRMQFVHVSPEDPQNTTPNKHLWNTEWKGIKYLGVCPWVAYKTTLKGHADTTNTKNKIHQVECVWKH